MIYSIQQVRYSVFTWRCWLCQCSCDPGQATLCGRVSLRKDCVMPRRDGHWSSVRSCEIVPTAWRTAAVAWHCQTLTTLAYWDCCLNDRSPTSDRMQHTA